MTRNAWNILAAGGPEAYPRAEAALREDTRAYWKECLSEPPADGMTYAPTVDALGAWIARLLAGLLGALGVLTAWMVLPRTAPAPAEIVYAWLDVRPVLRNRELSGRPMA